MGVARCDGPKFQIKENDMSKMRSDCVFSKLTPEQVETLEGWLFEENLSYKDALERAQKEFGIESSLTGLRRFYGRLAKERGRESLTEAMSMCVEAAALGHDDVLRAGLLTMANACAVQYLMQPPKDIRQFTAMLRAMTSAQSQEMKWIKFEREDGQYWRSRVMGEARKRKDEEEERERVEMNEDRSGEKEARQEAGNAAKTPEKTEAVNSESKTGLRVNATSPRPSPYQADSRGESKRPLTPTLSPSVGEGEGRVRHADKASGAAVVVPLKAA
jgi:hypothetical protein